MMGGGGGGRWVEERRRKKGIKRERLWKTQEERLRGKEGEKTEISTRFVTEDHFQVQVQK